MMTASAPLIPLPLGPQKSWGAVLSPTTAATNMQINFEELRSITCLRGTVGITKEFTEYNSCSGKQDDEGDTMAVTSLTFVTDDGKTYGPYGTEEGGVPFSCTGKIVGFTCVANGYFMPLGPSF